MRDAEVLPVEVEEYRPAYSGVVWWASFCLAAITGFSRLSYGLLLPAIRADLSGSYSAFGLVGTSNLVGYFLGTIAAPILLGRFSNRIKVNFVALVVMGGTLALSAISLDLWQLGFWRVLNGFFSALATVLTMTLTLERVRPAERGRASGLIWMGGSFGVIISGLLAPAIISTGSTLAWRFVWVAMGVFGVGVAVGFNRAVLGVKPPALEIGPGVAAAPKAEASLRVIMGELFRPAGLLFLTLAYFMFGFGYIIFSTFLISLLTSQGMPALLAGLVWSATGAMGVVGAFSWGRAVDRWPNGFLLGFSAGLAAFCSLGVLSGALPVEFVGAGLLTLALNGAPVITTILLKQAVPAERYTSSFSFITAIFAVGQFSGPLVGGIVVDNLGLAAGIATSGFLLGLSALFALGYGVAQRRSN